MIRVFIAVNILFTSLSLFSQNLTGTWMGGGANQQHKLVVIQKDSLLAGYIFEKSTGYCTADFEGVFYSSKARVRGEGLRFINKSLFHSLCYYEWRYVKNGNKEFLIGTASLKSALALGSKVSMQISRISESVDTTSFMNTWLKKKSVSEKTVTPVKDSVVYFTSVEKKNTTSDSAILKEAVKRNTHLNDVISVDTGNVLFTLYDNGTYDGDSVTIIHNGIVLLHKKEVSLDPLRFSIKVDKETPLHEIILFAENEGTIPPNTALLIIESKGIRHQLNLSSSLKTNEKIIIQLKE